MAIAVSEAAATAIAAAIREQTIQQGTLYVSLIAYLNLNFGQAATAIPGSPAAAQRVQAQAVNDISVVLTNMMDQQQKLISAIEVIQTALAGLNSQAAAGVTTQQLALSDQIKANKFKQQTTNESLKRAGLPETEVAEESFLESTKEMIDNTLSLKTQITIASLIERQLSDAITWIGTTMLDLVSQTFIGAAARGFVTIIKGWIGIKDPVAQSAKIGIAGKAAARAGLLVDPAPIPVEGAAPLP
jgi:hypothetical protein